MSTLTLDHDFNGEYGSGRYIVSNSESGQRKILEGKAAGLLALLLSDRGYDLREDFHPMDAFTDESLEAGRPS